MVSAKKKPPRKPEPPKPTSQKNWDRLEMAVDEVNTAANCLDGYFAEVKEDRELERRRLIDWLADGGPWTSDLLAGTATRLDVCRALANSLANEEDIDG